MNRIVLVRDLGEGLTRTRVRIEGDQCEPGTAIAEQMQHNLLTNIADNPQLVACGSGTFQRLQMYHDNTKWVIEVEATRKTGNG
jgi:hypothetical protein